MGRAIAAISVTALPHLARLDNALTGFFTRLFHELTDPYRPELHYMRGPGPACRAKHSEPR